MAQTFSTSADSKHPPCCWRHVALVFGAGLLTGLIYIIGPWSVTMQVFSEEEQIGRHLAQGDGYTSPYFEGRGGPPTSWCPPVFPAFFTAIYRVAGIDNGRSVALLLLLNVLARAAAAAGIFEIGRLLFARGAGIAAAGFFLIHPLFFLVVGYYWDNLLALSFFVWLIIAAIQIGRQGPTVQRMSLLGAGLGLLALTNTSYVLTFPVLVLVAVGGLSWRRRAILIAPCVICFGAVLVPWTVRNTLTFHKLFFVRANLNVELWIGNQPGSTGWMTMQTLAAHPACDPVERKTILAEGEIPYFRRCGRRFADEYRAAPVRFWWRCVNRIGYALLSAPQTRGGYPMVLVNLDFAALGIAGIVTAWKAHRRKVIVILATSLLAILPYLFTHVTDRYLLGFRAALAVFAGCYLSAWIQRWRAQPARWGVPCDTSVSLAPSTN